MQQGLVFFYLQEYVRGRAGSRASEGVCRLRLALSGLSRDALIPITVTNTRARRTVFRFLLPALTSCTVPHSSTDLHTDSEYKLQYITKKTK